MKSNKKIDEKQERNSELHKENVTYVKGEKLVQGI